MRKILLTAVVIMLLFCFAGCGRDSDDNAESHKDTSAPQTFDMTELTTEGHEAFQQNSANGNFRCIDGGIYSVCPDESSGSYIYFTDDAAHSPAIVCGKEGCPHASPDCDAYVDCFTFGLYNNKIYYAVRSSSGLDVFCMNPDGTDHRKINELALENPDYGSYYGCNHFFDNEFMYFDTDYENGQLLLGRLKLDEGSQPEYYNIDGIGSFFNDFVPTDGIVYVNARSLEGESNLYRCTLDAPPEIIIENYYDDSLESFVSGRHFSADKVRFYRYSESGTNGFYEWNAADSSISLVKEFAVPTNCAAALYDGDYIYLEEIAPMRDGDDNYTADLKFYIFDSSYNLIAASAIPFDKPNGELSVIMATDEQILFAASMWPEYAEHYINKSEISSGITWHEVN